MLGWLTASPSDPANKSKEKLTLRAKYRETTATHATDNNTNGHRRQGNTQTTGKYTERRESDTGARHWGWG